MREMRGNAPFAAADGCSRSVPGAVPPFGFTRTRAAGHPAPEGSTGQELWERRHDFMNAVLNDAVTDCCGGFAR